MNMKSKKSLGDKIVNPILNYIIRLQYKQLVRESTRV